MDLFHIIEDAHCVTRSKGVYRQCKVYRRGNRLYAGYGSGFIRLGGHGFTSHPDVVYEGLDLPDDVTVAPNSTQDPTIVRTGK